MSSNSSDTVEIFGAADVAEHLGVQRNVLSGYLKRYSDTPAAQYVTGDGRKFWSPGGMVAWREWFDERGLAR